MTRKSILVAVAGSLIIAWAIAQQPQIANNASARTETKVSESRKNGKYKRVTETFTDKALTTRKEEVSLKDNGQIDYVFIKLFRKGEMTYSSTFYKSESRTIRSYYHQGKMTVEEGDEDGDGFFETIILFNDKEQPVEAFSRSKVRKSETDVRSPSVPIFVAGSMWYCYLANTFMALFQNPFLRNKLIGTDSIFWYNLC